MCKKSTYLRFEKLYKYFEHNGDLIIKKPFNFYSICFNTKLGKRDVYMKKLGERICFGYDDYDNELLFAIEIQKSGKITILESKTNKPSIFLAIYEVENIVYKNKKREVDNILEKLFENIDEFSFNKSFFFGGLGG